MPSVTLDHKVPDFSLPAADGTHWHLKDALQGTLKDAPQGTTQSGPGPLVIYFYPKDMTAGCTTEAQAFRDLYPKFLRASTRIVGISRDSLQSHEKFRQKENLPFTLLSDTQEQVCKLFDVIREKTLYGRKHLGIERSTFLLDASGVLRHEWRKVKVNGHAEAVLEAAQSL